MDCKQAEKLIAPFLEETLDNKTLKEFLEHVEECPECREELNIQYLVMAGMSLLEEGVSFDLQKEMTQMLNEMHKKAYRRDVLTVFTYVLDVLALAAVIIILIMVIFK